MIRLRVILASLAFLLTGAAAGFGASAASGNYLASPATWAPSSAWQALPWHQFRIEQRFQVRITPGPATMPPAMIEEIEEQERVERTDVHKIGKCVGINTIAAVHPGDGDELLLFLHDDRIVSATLQKHCNARDFYSGFLLEPNADGAICTGRDILHSRSGDNCKVRRLHELVPTGYRRFP